MRLVKVCLAAALVAAVGSVATVVVGEDDRATLHLSPAGSGSAAAEVEKRDRLASRAARFNGWRPFTNRPVRSLRPILRASR